ncbi:MAG: heme biosynthesis HemY N-terminal domain-containing protein [Woeseiaceae bacterium]|nr:heme biosynthesis HemY N-terminal domain-containing protein [Woeseiaceae bacterium]
MKFGLIVILALVAGALGAHFLLQDPGYVIINFRSYVVEMSVPVLLGLVLATIVALWLLRKILRAPRRLGQAAGRLRSDRAGQKVTRGMIEIAEGNFARGEKLLARTTEVAEAPLLNYLQAARAAHLAGEHERRDEWLKEAYEQLPEAANAILLTQAEFQIDQKQYESALATLRRIEERSPNHSHALSLLGRLYFRLADWTHLAELLPRLRKHGRIDDETLESWSIKVHEEALALAADEASIDDCWNAVPKDLRSRDVLLRARCVALARVGAPDRAEKEIVSALKRGWSPTLVALYGDIESGDPKKQLKRAESWLEDHQSDAELLLTSAKLCLRNELWGKARSYLETVIGLRPTPEAYQTYGRLLNQLGEGDAAAAAWREGLALASGVTLPAIPHLADDPAGERKSA